MRLGFIGLGTMGAAIARNLLKAGHELTVWNRTPTAAQPLAAAGATVASEPWQAMQGDALLTMLANDEALRAIGLDGPLLARAAPGLVHVNHATVSLEAARALAASHAAHGVGYLAAPVFGRAPAAAAGQLTVVVGGPPELAAKLQPVFQAIGDRVVVVGDRPETANLFKIAGNFILAGAIESMGEAFALARKGGIDVAQFHEVMTAKLFAGVIHQSYGAMMVREQYEPPGFTLRLGLKDVNLALDAGRDLAVPVPLASLAAAQFTEALVRGLGEKDWAGLASLLAVKAGLPSADPDFTK